MVAAIAFESLVKLLAFLAVGRLRHVRHLRRLRRRLRARARPMPKLARDADAARRRRRRLRELGLAHDPVDAGDHVPAAPVPGRGDRERGREAPQQGDLAVPALHAGDQRLRAADRLRRPAALSRRQRRRRHVRADAADGGEAGAAGAARVHRRAVGGDRHGDRRDDRALDDGVQRPRDAGAAAAAAAAARPSGATSPGCCSASGAARSC